MARLKGAFLDTSVLLGGTIDTGPPSRPAQSVMDAIAYPLLCLVFYAGNWAILGFACTAASLVVWRHRSNIKRIVRGEEPRISFSGRGSAAREKKGDT